MIGYVIAMRGLTDRVREQCVYLFWRDIVGDRIAKRTLPDAVSEGVLKVHVQTSVWMHELQFHKPRMIVQINDWIAARRVWAGARPLVLDIRFVLGTPREPIADRDQLKRLQLSDRQRRLQARGAIAPPAVTSESDVQAIRAEVSVIEDDDLRALVESVRVTWSR